MQRLLIRCYCTGRQSYYDILGLSKTATAAEIKKAFYTLSKKYHPDLTGGNKVATKKFVAVKEAYDTLRDPNKRKGYDNQMAGRFSPSSYGYANQRYQSNTYQSGYQRDKRLDRIIREFERLQKELHKEQKRTEYEAAKAAEKRKMEAEVAEMDAYNKKMNRLIYFTAIGIILISGFNKIIFKATRK